MFVLTYELDTFGWKFFVFLSAKVFALGHIMFGKTFFPPTTEQQTQLKVIRNCLSETLNPNMVFEFVLTFSILCLPAKANHSSPKIFRFEEHKNNVSHFQSNYVLIFLDKRQSWLAGFGDNLITGEFWGSMKFSVS